MGTKKKKGVSWQRAVFLEACTTLKPFADRWHGAADEMEIEGMTVADTMQDIINRCGRPGYLAATAVASAWHWLLTDEDIRGDLETCSEYSVASDYYMAFWWLGMFHADKQPLSRRKAKKKAAKKRR
jgi:hypothetical protein